MLRGSLTVRCFFSEALTVSGWERISSVLSSSSTRHSIFSDTSPPSIIVSESSMPCPSYSSTVTKPDVQSMLMERNPLSWTISTFPALYPSSGSTEPSPSVRLGGGVCVQAASASVMTSASSSAMPFFIFMCIYLISAVFPRW